MNRLPPDTAMQPAIKSATRFPPRIRARHGQITRPTWSAATLSRLSFWRRGHSGDKSPHSKEAVIAHVHRIKVAPEANSTSNYTRNRRVQFRSGSPFMPPLTLSEPVENLIRV